MKRILSILIALSMMGGPSMAMLDLGISYFPRSSDVEDRAAVYLEYDLILACVGYMMKVTPYSGSRYSESIVYFEQTLFPSPGIKPIWGLGYAFRSSSASSINSIDDGLLGYIGAEFGIPGLSSTMSILYWIESVPVELSSGSKQISENSLAINLEFPLI